MLQQDGKRSKRSFSKEDSTLEGANCNTDKYWNAKAIRLRKYPKHIFKKDYGA